MRINTFMHSLRHYINLIEEINYSDSADAYHWIDNPDPFANEEDKTGEIDFDSDDDFETVIEKVRQNEDNRLGYGKYREGWHHPFDKRLVIKVAHPRDDNTIEECAVRNMWEFLVWNRANEKSLPEVEHLMPCYEIDPEGLWLTQRKGTRVPQDKEVPIKGDVSWIGDRKKENFAMLDGEYKSIDYGSKNAIEHLGIPEDYDKCKKLVAEILAKTGADVNSPDYGKSQRTEDPLDTDDS